MDEQKLRQAIAKSDCPECGGSGESGLYETEKGSGGKTITNIPIPCSDCRGTGKKSSNCLSCGGSGVIDGDFHDDDGNPIQGAENCPDCTGDQT